MEDPRRGLLKMSPGGVVLIYVVFGGLWILLSDLIVASLTNASPSATAFQSIKGAGFVFLSGMLIFGLLRYREGQLERSEHRRERKSQESRVLQRILRHNIRNDLNVIVGNIELARQELDDDDLSDRLRIAESAANSLISMSEKVRSIERIDLDETVPEPVDVAKTVHKATERLRGEHPTVSIHEEYPEACFALAGPSLRYAVDELLTNSVRHFDGRSDELRITTSVEALGDHVRIEIADNGPGIPEAELDPLLRGDETALQHASGIGLWLTHWFCDNYGGDVSFDSNPHEGTTVTITLDRAEPP